MIDEMELNEISLQIKKWIDRLDQVAISYEAKWGIGRLQKLISPDLSVKWNIQNNKLRAAIDQQDVGLIAELVEGTVRAWAALEQNAIANGHKPNEADYWEVTPKDSDSVYRIYKNNYDARSAAPQGVLRYSLTEVANILESQQLINQVKGKLGGTVQKIDHSTPLQDDDIPW